MTTTLWMRFGAASFLCAGLGSAAMLATEDQKSGTAPHTYKIDDLSWMSGSWVQGTGENTTDENWSHAAGGALMGTSRTVKAGKLVFFEYLRVETRRAKDEDFDRLYYVAAPNGGKSTRFELVKLEGKKAVFENPKHDFPKRISYWREGDDVLKARVEGDETSTEKPFELTFKARKP
ncbi:MAG: hypothetical protein JNL28_13840 [Planctomycetes bacterium]|nr:hypothetical protein [Planctomycetota bacterium]